MNEFSTVTLIERPPEDVFAVLTDIGRAPLWTPGLCEARQASPGPLEPGATLVYTGTFLGRRYESTVVCTDLAPNKRSG
jgi:uncharacterized protein YndB with AHSA1/START domain